MSHISFHEQPPTRRLRASIIVALLAASFVLGAGSADGSTSGGVQRWNASYQYGGPAISFDVGVSPDGSTVFVTGTTKLGKPSDAATLAYNASTGATKWISTYQSSDNLLQRDQGTRLAVSPDGSTVFVTGMSACYDADCTDGFNGWSTVAYDASTGAELWLAQYGADVGAYSIAVSPDGSKVFVNGQRGGGISNATIAYDASTGEQLWLLESDNSPVYWQALEVSPDSSTVFVATNVDWPTMPSGCRTSAYDANDGA